jgi:peptide/nickel transport system permease protein
MLRYFARRGISSFGVLIGLLSAVFVVTHLVGDPARLVLPLEHSNEQYVAVRHALGLDRSLAEQFISFITSAVHGDFGISVWQGVPALQLVLNRLPYTVLLAAVVVALAAAVGVAVGTIAGYRPGRRADWFINLLTITGPSLPEFWIGTVLVIVFAVQLRWLPTSGFESIAGLALPVLTLLPRPIGRIAQVARSGVAGESQQAYATTARAKGLSEGKIRRVHVLPNAALPIVTVIADEAAALLNGAVIVEVVFAWPGIGFLTQQAIERRDFPVIQAVVLVAGITIIVLNLISDLAYARLNPLVRLT